MNLNFNSTYIYVIKAFEFRRMKRIIYHDFLRMKKLYIQIHMLNIYEK